MRRRGFTLVEALLALALTAMLAAMVSSFLWSLSKSKQIAMADGARQRSLGLFMDRLEDDLATSIAGDDAIGAGIAGRADRLVILSRGVGIPTDPTLGEQAAKEQLSDLRGTEWAFAGATIVGRRWIGATPSGTLEPVAEGIAGVRFRYFDGKTWAGTYDSKARNALPVAVEVAVWDARGGPMSADGSSAKVAPEEPAMAEFGGLDVGSAGAGVTLRAPDSWRLITIPDGPAAGWKEGA